MKKLIAGLVILVTIVLPFTITGQNKKTFRDNSFSKGDIIQVPTINVEVLNSDIQNDSLDLLIAFLTKHQNLKVEIGCHTASQGNLESNKQRSQYRAQGIRDYLIKNKNISAERLTAKGYGETKLIILDQTIANAKTQAEKDRLTQINNRIELTVLEGSSTGTIPMPSNPVTKPTPAKTSYTKGDLNIAGNLLYGESPAKPLSNTKVDFVNDKKEVVQSTTTNAFGAFVFTNLQSNQNFSLKIDEKNPTLTPDTKITITNRNGKEMQSKKLETDGNFNFSFFAEDKATLDLMSVEYKDLRFDLRGKLFTKNKSAVNKGMVNLLNEKGEIVISTKVDADGNFEFLNLRANQDSLFAIGDKNTTLIDFQELFLADEKGNIIKEFTSTSDGFKFTILPGDENKLGQVYVDDPWLKVLDFKSKSIKDSVTITENIYYNSGEYQILPEAKLKLDKVINIMRNDPQLMVQIMSHTDSRSSADYNLKLSQDRAKATVDYFIAQGIAKERVTGKGFGETKLINRCADGVQCSDEEHAKNRRTEFKIFRKQK